MMKMKRLSYWAFLMLISITLVSCGGKSDAEWKEQVDSLQTALKQNNADYQQLNEALTVISESLDSIAMQESELFKADKESPMPNQQAIKENLARFKESLKTQRERIAQLEKQLSNSSGEVKKLQRIIIALKAQLTEKESQIAALQEEVSGKNMTIADLRTRMGTLTQESEQQQRVISMQNKIMETQDQQLNEGYVIIASKSELKKAGLLKGGFLKKSTVDLSGIDKSLFKAVDTRIVTEIAIDSKSPTIITQMPEDSYQIEKTGKTSVLRITKPDRFWEVSKYLIIQTN